MEKHFATRIVKNGKVKVNGRYYAPSTLHEDPKDRFEGRKWHFGLYDHKPEVIFAHSPADGGVDVGLSDDGKSLPWLWWYEVTV